MILNAQKQYFEKHQIERGLNILPYRMSKPQNFNENDTIKYPLILFLHGSGERGFDNELQITYIDKIFGSESFRKKYACFVLAPQCPEEMRWVDVDWNLTTHKIPDSMSEPMKLVVIMLNNVLRNYPIDKNRIYITGLSMGGYGTWDLIARFPNLFAAAIPICGGGDENTANLIYKIPIWTFHGAKDKVVPVSRTQNMVKAIQAQGGTPKYTEYPNEGHLVWNLAYTTVGIWDWLFGQVKK